MSDDDPSMALGRKQPKYRQFLYEEGEENRYQTNQPASVETSSGFTFGNGSLFMKGGMEVSHSSEASTRMNSGSIVFRTSSSNSAFTFDSSIAGRSEPMQTIKEWPREEGSFRK